MRCQADWEAPIRPLARGAPPRGADTQLNGPVRGSLSVMRAAQFVGVCGARSMWHGAAARRERRGRSTPRLDLRSPLASPCRGRCARGGVVRADGGTRRDSRRPTSPRPRGLAGEQTSAVRITDITQSSFPKAHHRHRRGLPTMRTIGVSWSASPATNLSPTSVVPAVSASPGMTSRRERGPRRR
jgi:hypothetical protein